MTYPQETFLLGVCVGVFVVLAVIAVRLHLRYRRCRRDGFRGATYGSSAVFISPGVACLNGVPETTAAQTVRIAHPCPACGGLSVRLVGIAPFVIECADCGERLSD